MIHYDPPLPELPLLRGLHLTGGAPRPPRVDWASFVIRLAQVIAERRDPLPPATPSGGPTPPRRAIDLACGEGRDTAELIRRR